MNGTGIGFEIDDRYLGILLIPGAGTWATSEDDRLSIACRRKSEESYGQNGQDHCSMR